MAKLELLSRTIYDANGVQTVWDFNFAGGYILPDHVKAYYELGAVRTPVTVSLIGANQAYIVPAVPAGAVLTIYRDTPKNAPLVDFVDRGTVSEVALDTVAKQAVFAAAESSDSAATGATDVAVAAAATAQASALAAAGSATSAAASKEEAESILDAIVTTVSSAVASVYATLLAVGGALLVGFKQLLPGAVARTVADKFYETVSVKDFGAVGNGVADDTAAVQAAINSGRSVEFPEGVYSCTALTQSEADQHLIAMGDVVISRRSGAAPVLSSSGRAVVFRHIKFLGTTGTGNAVVCTGDNPVFDHCSAWTSSGYALWSKGNGTRIIGTTDIYYSPDVAGAAIAIGVTGTQTYYAQIMGIATSTSAVGVKYFDHGASGISNCQLNKVDMTEGAAYISNCRIVGDYVVGKSFNLIDNSTISGNVTLGTGSAISGIGFGDKVFMQSGATLTVNTNIRESSLNLAHLGSSVTIVDNLTGTATDVQNSIFTAPRSYTPSWTAATTNPVLGNGTITGTYTRSGSLVTDTLTLTMGSSTTFGVGEYNFGLSHVPPAQLYNGSGVLLSAGVALYTAIMRTKGNGTARMAGFTNNAGTGIQQNSPFIWKSGDVLNASITYSV